MRKLVISTLVGSLAVAGLTGCVTDPNTGQQKLSKGAIGAIGGAALGAVVDKNHRGRGAAIGAVVGGGVGVYMDAQAKKMQEQMRGTGVNVVYDQANNALKLVMPGNITFATAKYDLAPNFTQTLDKVAATLVEYKDTTITVAGHTDNVGNAAYNQQLSQNRAASVTNYLVAKGVGSGRISSVGMGMNSPVADNATEAGRSQNRRVEININPLPTAGATS